MSISPHNSQKNRDETMTHETQIELPGLELRSDTNTPDSPLRTAVVATIEALRSDGLLEPRHVALCALALILADAVTAGSRSGRASAAAMAAAQLRETLEALPKPAEGGAEDKMNKWLTALEAAANAGNSADSAP